MKLQTYKKTEVKIIDGYHFDGTFECAKEIYQSIKSLKGKDDAAFKLNYNFQTDSFEFSWGGFEIKEGDFVALRENDGLHYPIEVITKVELSRWGYQLEK
jgi:hypothetical protein